MVSEELLKKRPKRIIITGDAGRGKTTFANRLAAKLNIPCYHTDDFYWEVKFSRPADKLESLKRIVEVYKKDSWIVEGTSRHLILPGLAKADLVIYLKHRKLLNQYYVLFKRHRLTKNESFRELLGLYKHLFIRKYRLSYERRMPPYERILNPYRNKCIFLDSFKAMDDFLEKI